MLKVNDVILRLPTRFLELSNEYVKEIAGGSYLVKRTMLKDASGSLQIRIKIFGSTIFNIK